MDEAHDPSNDEPIHYHPIGDAGTPSTPERLGLYAWFVAMSGFLVWLVGFGVNV